MSSGAGGYIPPWKRRGPGRPFQRRRVVETATVSTIEGEAHPDCERCGKTAALCVCADVAALPNRIEVLILQHPQEQDRDLGTARLALLHLQRGRLSIGLSWPNLAKALGRPADPRRWGVLYLGAAQLPEGGPAIPGDKGALSVLDRDGVAAADQTAALRDLDGIVLLDGTWSQAKALWWRNAWLLKLRRLVLTPAAPSRYGRLRREPRKESVSTLEALAQTLGHLEARPEYEREMCASFEHLLQAFARSKAKPSA